MTTKSQPKKKTTAGAPDELDAAFDAPKKSGSSSRKKKTDAARKKTQSAASPKKPRRSPAQKKRRAAAKRRARARKTLYGLLSALFFAIAAGICAFCAVRTSEYFHFLEMRALLDTDAFYPGMCVDGMDLGGMRLSQATEIFREKELSLSSSGGVTFTLDGETYTITPGQAGYGSNYAAVLHGAWEIGRHGTLEERYAAALNGCSYTVSRGYDAATLRSVTDALAAQLTTPALNSEVTGFIPNRGQFTFSEEQTGKIVDADQLYQQALAVVGEGGTVEVQRTVLAPTLTAADLQESYGERSVAVTNASSSPANRLSNIKLACSTISGTCLQPGEEFSFNAVVGKRTAAAGYKKAGVYVSGELGEEIGGGICQVATTLFNAAVKADLEITERHQHSRPVTYVDKGKDATVSWGLQDLKFVNSQDEPIYIVAYVNSDKRVKVHIFGKLRTDGVKIEVVPQITEISNPGSDTYRYVDDLPTGETRVKDKARKGYKVNTYKIFYDAAGNPIEKEFLCYSSYAAKGAIIEVGR